MSAQVYITSPSSSDSITLTPTFLYSANDPIIQIATPQKSKKNVVTIEPLYPYSYIPSNDIVSLYPSSQLTYYYDTGIGTNPLAQHEVNEYLRYKFLDHELIHDYKDILKMLKVEDKRVTVMTGKGEGEIGTESEVEKKIDFIGNEILTRSKNMKILQQITTKNYHIHFYDLPHNPDLVFSTQAKYVKQKIRDLRKQSN